MVVETGGDLLWKERWSLLPVKFDNNISRIKIQQYIPTFNGQISTQVCSVEVIGFFFVERYPELIYSSYK